jgi:hypothetical protein
VATPRTARGWVRLPCGHFKIQSCFCVGSRWRLSKTIARILTAGNPAGNQVFELLAHEPDFKIGRWGTNVDMATSVFCLVWTQTERERETCTHIRERRESCEATPRATGGGRSVEGLSPS